MQPALILAGALLGVGALGGFALGRYLSGTVRNLVMGVALAGGAASLITMLHGCSNGPPETLHPGDRAIGTAWGSSIEYASDSVTARKGSGYQGSMLNFSPPALRPFTGKHFNTFLEAVLYAASDVGRDMADDPGDATVITHNGEGFDVHQGTHLLYEVERVEITDPAVMAVVEGSERGVATIWTSPTLSAFQHRALQQAGLTS